MRKQLVRWRPEWLGQLRAKLVLRAADREDQHGNPAANAKGFTLYWLSLDTLATSKCSGACASTWPPVAGPVSAAVGVSLSGKLATITRPDGSKQETYNGHPLHTFSGDSGPGKTGGNGISGVGGTWHAVPISGAVASASSPPGSGGGYGY